MNEEEVKTEQTAVAEDTKEAPKQEAPAESGAAQEDGLDELLKEFDERREAASQTTEKPAGTTEPKASEQIDVAALAALEKRLNDTEARESRRELERLFDRFTTGVQADSLDAEAFLNAKALRDPRINQAYLNRGNNPKAWDKVEGALRQEFQKRFGKAVDKQVTESRDAVASAVRSASTAAPQKDLTDKDILNMPQEEWLETQRKLGITPV